MDELEKYECFSVPAHVWMDDNAVAMPATRGTSARRGWVYREAAMLGMEAIPSPALAEFLPAK